MANLNRALFPCFILALMLSSCGDEQDTTLISSVSKIQILDNDNSGNGSDIEVNFREPSSTDNIKEYRVLILKAGTNQELTLGEANSVSPDRFTAASPDDVYPVQGIELSAISVDLDGDLIISGQEYDVAVLSVSKDQESFSNALELGNEPFSLEVNNLLERHTQEIDGGSGSMSIDPSGNIFMADYRILVHLGSFIGDDFNVFKISNTGSLSTYSSPYSLLGGNALDSQGNLYQALLLAGDIMKISPTGESTLVEHEGVFLPQVDGLYIDTEGNVFVIDPELGRVIKITPEGTSSVYAELGLNMRPRGITGDESGNLYISHNIESGRITKITDAGVVTTLTNIPTSIPEFYVLDYIMWVGYITYNEGSLYVAGQSTDKIYKISLEGNIEVFAGSGTRGSPRGGALSANLNRPVGLVFSDDGGKLFVSGCTDTTPQHTQASTPAKIWQIEINEENN